jgi:4'-phosphopantetheinyl transferase
MTLIDLAEGEVHVGLVNLATTSRDKFSALRGTLSTDELDRERCFHSIHHAATFVEARGYLREILSYYVNSEPSQLAFDYTKYGKPLLKQGNDTIPRIEFNLSHSRKVAMYAIGRVEAIGIDVESVEDLPFEMLANDHFCPKEIEQFSELHAQDKLKGFYCYWTRKEAYLKATGFGFAKTLNTFSVTLSPHSPPELLSDSAVSSTELDTWKLLHLEPCIGYVGAVAVKSQNPSFRHFSITQEETRT